MLIKRQELINRAIRLSIFGSFQIHTPEKPIYAQGRPRPRFTLHFCLRNSATNTCTIMSFFNKVFGKKEMAEEKTPSPGQSSEDAARKEEAERKKKIGRSSRQLQQALEAYPQIIYPEEEHLLNQPFNPNFIKKEGNGNSKNK